MKLYGFFTVPRGSGVGALPVAVRWGSCTLPVVGQQWVQLPQLRHNPFPALFRRVGPCHQLRPLGGDDLVPPIVYFSGLPGPCSHHGAQGGRLPTPWTVSTPHRPSGISFLSNFYDRQVLFTGIPAFPAAGNRRRVNLRKKTRERTRPCGHRPTSRVFLLSRYSFLLRLQECKYTVLSTTSGNSGGIFCPVSRAVRLTYSALNTIPVY